MNTRHWNRIARAVGTPLALSFMALLTLSATAAAQWSSGPSLSNPRSAPGVVRHGGDIYAVGGFSSPNSLEVLYSGGTSWITLAPLPIGQQGLAAAVVGDRIYTFGSYGFANTCQIYDIATNTWQVGPPVPVGLYWSTAEAVGTNIYLIAGYVSPGISSKSMFILDTTTNTWMHGASLPGPILLPASVTHGPFIYVFGNFAIYGSLAYVKYDVLGGTWSTFTGPPSGHGGSSEAVSAGNFVYLMGGSPGNIYTAYQTVEVYDPSSGTWLPGPSLINGRYQFGAVYLPNEDNIYAVAGRDGTASPMTSVEILRTAAPTSYCTAKPGLACGLPVLTTAGHPDPSKSSGFFVFAGPAGTNKAGLLLYGNTGRNNAPFHGGTLCVNAPVRRTIAVNSGGFTSCDGEFSIDMNAFAAGALGGHPQSFLVTPGNTVDAQWWGHDTLATGAFLSDAVEWNVVP